MSNKYILIALSVLAGHMVAIHYSPLFELVQLTILLAAAAIVIALIPVVTASVAYAKSVKEKVNETDDPGPY